MKSFKPIALLTNLILATIVGVAFSVSLESAVDVSVHPIIPTATLFATGFVMKLNPGVMFMGLQTEVWVQDIQEVLYQNNEFIRFSIDDSAFVNNLVVHLPQSGPDPGIEVNRTVLPAPISERTDEDFTYLLREFTSNPTLIRDLDEIQTSYGKRQSVLRQHVKTQQDRLGTETAHIWSADSASNLVRTTGATNGVGPAGSTGTRRIPTKEDFSNVAQRFDEDNVPNDGNRYCLMAPEMYYALFETDQLIRRDFMGNAANLPKGVINELLGFKIMVRNNIAIYDNSDAKLAVGGTIANDSSFSSMFWHSDFVRHAEGDIKVFAEEDKAAYYGSIFSTRVDHGAKRARKDEKGVINLVQATS